MTSNSELIKAGRAPIKVVGAGLDRSLEPYGLVKRGSPWESRRAAVSAADQVVRGLSTREQLLDTLGALGLLT